MAIQLYCKRSKIFMRQTTGKKTEKVTCARGETTNVPDWVKDTLGYAQGIKDKSILDLTPAKAEPKAAPEAAPKAAPEAVADAGNDDVNVDDASGDGGDDAAQQEKKSAKRAPRPGSKGLQAPR